MYSFLLIIIFLASSICSAKDSLALAAKYQSFQPYPQHLTKVMPSKCIQVGRGNSSCQIKPQLEDDSAKMRELIKETESQFNIQDPYFLSSYIGEQYQALKSVLKVYDQFNSCKQNTKFLTKQELSNTLDKILTATSQSPLDLSSLNRCVDFPNNTLSTPIQESQLEDLILHESLKRNIQSALILQKKFNNKSLKHPSLKQKLLYKMCHTQYTIKVHLKLIIKDKNICDDQDKSTISNTIDYLIEEVEQDSSVHFIDNHNIVSDLNQRISKVNALLKEYNQTRRQLQEQWDQEDSMAQAKNRYQRERLPLKIKQKREKQLLQLKKEKFNSYRVELAQLNLSGPGELLQTFAVREKIKLDTLEELDTPFFGLFGFDTLATQYTGDFPFTSTY